MRLYLGKGELYMKVIFLMMGNQKKSFINYQFIL